jgi:hypothetical protein
MLELPLESRTARELGAEAPGDWTVADELLALAVESIEIANYLFLKVNTKKGTDLPKPMRIPRPGAETGQAKEQSSTAELGRFFGGPGVIVNYTPQEASS